MLRLHAVDDSELRETVEVALTEQLGVLAAAADTELLERVEGKRIRPVADRVHIRHDSGLGGTTHQRDQPLRRYRQQTAGIRGTLKAGILVMTESRSSVE